jgi:drug/metabolite transporter (DMT)-like permease
MDIKPISSVNYLKGAILVFIGAVLFAGKAVLVKYNYIHYHVDTVPLLVLRMGFALPFYIVILLIEKNKTSTVAVSLTTRQWLWMLALGIVGYYLASLFDFWGLNYVSAGIERLILFLYPSIVLIISAVFLKKKIVRIQYIALFITYLGVVCTFVPDIKIGIQHNLIIGSALIFLSAFTYALYLIGSGELIPKIGTIRFTSYAMIISTIVVILHHLFTVHGSLFNYQKEVYYLSFTMAVFCTVIPSFFISGGIKLIGSGNASIIGSVGPIATIIMASIFLDELFTGWQLTGTIIVLAGVLMISWKGNK